MSMRVRGTSTLPWWLFLVTGVAWLLISLIVLRFDVTSIAAVGALLGVILIGQANEFAIMSIPGWRWLHAILRVLFIGGGIWAFIHPINAFYELAAILGFPLLLGDARHRDRFHDQGDQRPVVARPRRRDPRDPARRSGRPSSSSRPEPP